MTVGEWIQAARERLAACGIEAAGLEAQLLAGHVLLVDRPWLIAHAGELFPDLAGEAVLAERLRGRPLAYILGYREFYGRRFFVAPGVLIPRQETELLVEETLRELCGLPSAELVVLDLGAGSGCIGITLKLERPSWRLIGTDISLAAIVIAADNARELGAELNVIQADGLTAVGEAMLDAIVTNPPYIGNNEDLPVDIRHFEPDEALFAGPTGLEFFARLAREAMPRLKSGGKLIMEVGYRQASEVENLFTTAGWTGCRTVVDLAGTPRVVVCTKPDSV